MQGLLQYVKSLIVFVKHQCTERIEKATFLVLITHKHENSTPFQSHFKTKSIILNTSCMFFLTSLKSFSLTQLIKRNKNNKYFIIEIM